MKRILTIVAITACCVQMGIAQQKERWHQYSLTPHLGFVAFPAILDDKGPYEGGALDGSLETGISFLSVLSPKLELEGTLSKLTSSGAMESGAAGSSRNYLNVDLEVTTLWVTLKYYPSEVTMQRSVRPWYAGGIHAGIVEEGYSERLYVSGSGYSTEDRTVNSSPLVGCHAIVGLDIYPHRKSAICLTAQARINLTMTGSDFSGTLISPALLLGLRWDFGLNGD
jgi:hypothetical protein